MALTQAELQKVQEIKDIVESLRQEIADSPAMRATGASYIANELMKVVELAKQLGAQ